VWVNGHPLTVKINETRYSSDPVVLAHPALFSDDPVVIARYPGWQPDVEQATAAPGERRASRRAD
jgi:hypothetical protein